MSRTAKETERIVGDLLKKNVPEVGIAGRREWSLTFASNGTPVRGRARIEEEWLCLDAPLEPRTGPKAWNLLRRNALLDGLAKFALLPGDRAPRLAAEIPLADGFGLSVALEATLRGFVARSACDAEKDGSRGEAEVEPDQTAMGALADRCVESGWTAEPGREDALVIRLPVRRGSYSAAVTTPRGGGALVSANLSSCRSLSARSRRAMSLLLLTACASVRYARAAIGETRDGLAARFEVRLLGSPGATDLDRALSAVSVACEFCGPEVKAVENDAAAARYLECRT